MAMDPFAGLGNRDRRPGSGAATLKMPTITPITAPAKAFPTKPGTKWLDDQGNEHDRNPHDPQGPGIIEGAIVASQARGSVRLDFPNPLRKDVQDLGPDGLKYLAAGGVHQPETGHHDDHTHGLHGVELGNQHIDQAGLQGSQMWRVIMMPGIKDPAENATIIAYTQDAQGQKTVTGVYGNTQEARSRASGEGLPGHDDPLHFPAHYRQDVLTHDQLEYLTSAPFKAKVVEAMGNSPSKSPDAAGFSQTANHAERPAALAHALAPPPRPNILKM